MRLDLPQTRRPASPAAPQIECQLCRDAGYHRLDTNEWPGSAVEAQNALECGQIALCVCERGQWWFSWLTELGRATGQMLANVPDSIATGPAAIEWLRNFERRLMR